MVRPSDGDRVIAMCPRSASDRERSRPSGEATSDEATSNEDLTVPTNHGAVRSMKISIAIHCSISDGNQLLSSASTCQQVGRRSRLLKLQIKHVLVMVIAWTRIYAIDISRSDLTSVMPPCHMYVKRLDGT